MLLFFQCIRLLHLIVVSKVQLKSDDAEPSDLSGIFVLSAGGWGIADDGLECI